MVVDEELLARARKDDRDAVIEVMSMQYPAAFRIAHALTGRAELGDGIVQFVMRRAFKALSSWKDAESPQRWFRHHTVLSARRAVGRQQRLIGADTLHSDAGSSDPAYAAFVLALRALPHQQREAFLLHHGEQLDNRATATAMDCSTTAATQHLESAESRLRALGGADYDALVGQLSRAYLALAPVSDLVLARVARDARKFLWPRKLARFITAALLICIIFVLAYVGVKWWQELFVWFKDVISH